MKKDQKTSWEPVSKWYGKIVGDEGHYFHQKIIMPGILRLFELKSTDSVLDLACGQGVLAGQLPQNDYLGIDISPSLIKMASAKDKNRKHGYMVADITKSLKLEKQFTHAAIVLALQNIEHPELVLKNARKHLMKDGRLAIVLNHPCFRIPRQSSWQIDEQKKMQFRRLDRYYTPMTIPIQAFPSKGEQSITTISYHYPIASFSKWLQDSGFVIEVMEEWCSDKESIGKNAKMENRSREEFPLFLTIIAKAI